MRPMNNPVSNIYPLSSETKSEQLLFPITDHYPYTSYPNSSVWRAALFAWHHSGQNTN